MAKQRRVKMTERQWLTEVSPAKLIRWVGPRATSRKNQLLMCVSGRALDDLLYDDSSREAIRVAEDFVDGIADADDLHEANYSAECPTFGYDLGTNFWLDHPTFDRLGCITRLVALGAVPHRAFNFDNPKMDGLVQEQIRRAAEFGYYATLRGIWTEGIWFGRFVDFLGQCHRRLRWPNASIIHCIYGNPFAQRVARPDWLVQYKNHLRSVAQYIYDRHAFDHMPILADALIECGCDDEPMIDHCRTTNHARGCWVIDLLLDKPDPIASINPLS